MRFLGLDFKAGKDGLSVSRAKALSPVHSGAGRGWWPLIREPFAGAWQRNMETSVETLASHFAVYSCVKLISQDIGKLRFVLKKQNGSTGIWTEVKVPNIHRVLMRPNNYQNHIQFKEQWITSKLMHGNAYILKQRDQSGYVIALRVLDPTRVVPLVADNGDVFYQLKSDNLAGLFGKDFTQVTVPASEIVHDRMTSMYHPLVGISPLAACGLSAAQGLDIQQQSRLFFSNASMPGGILSSPHNLSVEKAQELSTFFNDNFTGANAGAIAVLGDGLKFEPMVVSASDSQLIEQLKWTAENVCACFNVPSYKVIGQAPSIGNVEAMELSYYTQCLQSLMESMEFLMDEALEFKTDVDDPFGVELDLSQLLRMDTKTRFETLNSAVGGGWLAPNEARAKEDYEPVKGGEKPVMQQQNYSLEDLARRSDRQDPFAPLPAPVAETTTEPVAQEPAAAATEAPISSSVLQAPQIQVLMLILADVGSGKTPKEVASALIANAFPLFTAEQISAMLDPIEIKEPEETPPPAAPTDPNEPPAPPAPDDTEEGEDELEEEQEEDADEKAANLLAMLAKTFTEGLT